MTTGRDSLFERLLVAENEDEELQLVLSGLPDDEREAVWVAAVPHWFNGAVLATLLAVDRAEGDRLYNALQSLALVSPYQGRGSCIHDQGRTILLRLWSTRRRAEFSIVSRR